MKDYYLGFSFSMNLIYCSFWKILSLINFTTLNKEAVSCKLQTHIKAGEIRKERLSRNLCRTLLSHHFTSTIQVAIGGAISKEIGTIYSRRCESQYLSSGQFLRKPIVCRI